MKRHLYLKNNLESFLKEEQFLASTIITPILSILILYLLKQLDLINLTNAGTTISILTAIASILASIIGIIIAISLVSFSLQRKLYGSFAFEKFFQNLPFRFLLWFFILAIIVTIIAAVSIGQNLTVINQWSFRISLFLFIYCLLILPFGVQEILTSSEPKRKIKKSINALIKLLGDTKVSEFSSNLEVQHEILTLKEVFVGMLKNDDQDGIKLILSEFSKKYFDAFMDRNGAIKSSKLKPYFNLLEYFSMESFKHRNEFALREILNCIRETRELIGGSSQKEKLLSSLDGLLRNILLRGVEKDFISVCKKGFEVLEENLMEDLENYPFFFKEENDVRKLETIKYHQKNYIEVTYISILNAVMQKAIDIERLDIIHRGFLSIQKLAVPVVLNDNLDNYVTQNIINDSYSLIKLLTIRCVKKGIYEMVSESIFYAFGIIFHFFTKDTYMYETPTRYFSETLINIAARKAIDLNYCEIGLPYMFGIAKKSLEHLDNKHFLNILNIAINTFDSIRAVTEKEINTLEEARANIIISEYFKEFSNLIKDKNIRNNSIEKKILLTLEKFKLNQ